MGAENSSGVTAPAGFVAAGVHCGIKSKKTPDLTMVLSDVPASWGGVFTTNTAAAAPVVLCRRLLKHATMRGVVINSGNANACTGSAGLRNARAMIRIAQQTAHTGANSMLVASTGIIGVPLPMGVIAQGIEHLLSQLSASGGSRAAEGIRTTDTFRKEAVVDISVGTRSYHVGGMAKGSGMIHPNMATMLACITTDVQVDSPRLRAVMHDCVRDTFNSISVDGDTSTNDSVFLFANGASGYAPGTPGGRSWNRFESALHDVCSDLARQIIRDGEGASKFVTVQVMGARSKAHAEQFANAVIRSPLVKTALAGENPNWGRFISALGSTGLPLRPEQVRLELQGSAWIGPDYKQHLTPARAHRLLKKRDISLTLHVGRGNGNAIKYTCDLTHGYIDINMDYS